MFLLWEMKVFAAAIAVLLSAFLWVRLSQNGETKFDGGDNTPGNSRITQSRRTSLPSPQEASSSLRHLREENPDSSYSYNSVAGMVSRLSDSDLKDWAREMGFQSSLGYDVWIRSAIYSEWARRDLDGLLAWLREPKPGVTMSDSTLQQVSFAIFEGSKPSDPVEALNHLNDLRLKIKGTHLIGGTGLQWAREAMYRTYADIAKLDHELAWKTFLAARESNFKYNSPFLTNDNLSGAVAGIFEGLPVNQMEKYANDWMSRFYDPDQDEASANEELGFQLLRAPNPTNNDLVPILSAWLQKSPDEALEWAAKISGEEKLLKNRIWQAHSSWAKSHPEEALSSLRSLSSPPAFAGALATGLLRGDPHLAPALMNVPANGFNHHDSLVGSITLNTMLEGSAQYPSTDRTNRPPDYQQRYESFKKAIELGEDLNDRQKSQLRESLERQFKEIISD